MATNLVVIALDGVSQTLFWQYREAMPTLWRLSNHSAMFRRFYSASTSAFQSFCDFAHGDASELDHNTVYPSQPGCLAGRASNLFEILHDRGYGTLGMVHGNPCPEYARHNFWGAWPEKCGTFQCHEEYAGAYAAVEEFLHKSKATGTPFVLYYSDRVAKTGDRSPEKQAATLYHERFKRGFSLLDASVAKLFSMLTELELLPNTIVAIYGPYGMDPWKHGISQGRTHAIDPYADLCWTPLMIYNNEHDIGIADQLFSSIDLKPTLLHMLFPNEPQPDLESALVGVDILRFRRQTVLTQNMFALEREGDGPALGIAKSYAATDGDQRLIVSSEKGIYGSGGMELFFDPRDPGNTRNFLDFFTLDDNGTMTSFGRSDIIHVHFIQSFKPKLVMSIVNSYNKMRPQLYEFIRIKERNAMDLAGAAGQENIISDEVFTRKRKRK